jgi:hypothetical protein
MSIVVNLNVPAGNGVGTASDTSSQALEKTITVGGTFTGSITVEATMGGGGFVPVATLTAADNRVLQVVATEMRVRRAAVDAAAPGAPVVDVTAERASVSFQALAVPASDGVGASSDISSFGDDITAIVTGDFAGSGALTVEVSADDVNWASLGRTFAAAGHFTVRKPAAFARVRRAGATFGAVPAVYVGSATVGGTGVGGVVRSVWDEGTLNVYVDADAGDDSNSGLSADDALQTLQEVYRKFPTRTIPPGIINVNLAAGAGDTQAVYETSPWNIDGPRGTGSGYNYHGPPMIAYAPATGPASATLDAGTPATRVDASTSPSGTGLRCQLNFTTAAPGWTVEDFTGRTFARITRGGTRVIAEIPISENTADTIVVDHEDIVGVVQAGDLVEVVIPGAVLDPLPVDFFGVFDGTTGQAWFSGFSPFPTFSRLQIGIFITRASAPLFDRCIIADFFEGGTPHFTNCCARDSNMRLNGCQGSLSPPYVAVLPDEVAPLDTDIVVNYVAAGPNQAMQFGFPDNTGNQSLGEGTYSFYRLIVRRTNAANGNSFLLTQAGQRVLIGRLVLAGAGGGTGALINISQNGYLKLPTEANLDVDTGGTLQGVRMLKSGNSVNLDSAVGGFYEVAGYNGNYFDPPSAPGDQGDFSLVTSKLVP